MKNYKFVGEGPNHIEVQHADGSKLKIAKQHLDLKMMAKISQMPKVQKFDDGGDAGLPQLGLGSPEMASNNPDPSGPTAFQQIAQFATRNSDSPYTPLQPSMDITANSRSGDDDAAAAPIPGSQDAQVGGQTYPTPDGGAPAGSSLPPTTAGSPSNPFAAPSAQMQSDMSQLKQANLDKATSEGKASQDIAGIQTKLANDYTLNEANRQKSQTAIDTENQQIKDNIETHKLDPNHYFQDKSTGAKIAMLAGIVLSGFGGGGANGQSNMALDVIKKNVDRDVEAQQSYLGTQKTLLEANLKKYGNLEMATQATKLNLMSVAQAKIAAAGASQGTPQAMAAAKAANAQLDMQYSVPLSMSIAKWQSGQQQLDRDSGGSQQSGFDLNRLSALSYGVQNGMSPYGKDDIEAAKKEAGAYDASKTGLANVLNQFDSMAKTKGSLVTTEPGWVPDAMRDQNSQSYDASKSAISAETSKVFGEKPSIALMAEVDPLFPKAGDPPAKIQEKRQQIENVFKKAAIEKAGGFQASRRMGLIKPSDPMLSPNVIQPGK